MSSFFISYQKILEIYGLINIDVVSIKKRSNASVPEYYIYKTGVLFLTNELTKFLKQINNFDAMNETVILMKNWLTENYVY